MKRLKINKKIMFFILIIFILLIVFFSYIKISGHDNKDSLSEEKLMPESSSKNLENNLAEHLTEKREKNPDKKTEILDQKIIKIAHIDEIKSPFKAEKIEKNTEKSRKREIENIKIKNNKTLNDSSSVLYLENNLIGKNLSDNKNINLKDIKISKNKDNKSKKKEAQAEAVEIKKEKTKINMLNSKFSFKLLGIIKNKENSTALISYQGRTLIVKENDFLDKLLIKEINNKSLVISINGEKIKVRLWEEEK